MRQGQPNGSHMKDQKQPFNLEELVPEIFADLTLKLRKISGDDTLRSFCFFTSDKEDKIVVAAYELHNATLIHLMEILAKKMRDGSVSEQVRIGDTIVKDYGHKGH